MTTNIVMPVQTQVRLNHVEVLVEEKCKCGYCESRQHSNVVRYWERVR